MKIVLIVIILLAIAIFMVNTSHKSQPVYGVTFSPMYAKYLKQDYQKMYISILDDLKIRSFRIPTYWSQVETIEGKYDFSEVDFMVSEAQRRGAKITLVVGIKQPRWPEYHLPKWAGKLTVQQKQEKALKVTEEIINRYKSSPAITAWQVENEPFVTWFGEGIDLNLVNQGFLTKEINLVKSLDSNRPVVVTDTGEWSLWKDAASSGDILGISLYRKAYNDKFGYITYPFFPSMYIIKSGLVRKVFAPENQKTIISELQAEPWLQKGVIEFDASEQAGLFTIKELEGNVDFARKTGFNEIYLWGVEWWYYMAQNGHPEYLEFAQTLF